MPVRITADGESWLSEDYTLDEMVQAEKLRNQTWAGVLAGAEHDAESIRALLIPWYCRGGTSVEDAAKRAGALTNRQIKVERVDDDRPTEYDNGIPVVDPKADTAGPATT